MNSLVLDSSTPSPFFRKLSCPLPYHLLNFFYCQGASFPLLHLKRWLSRPFHDQSKVWESQNNIQNTCSNLLPICTTTSNRLAARSENAKTKQILNIQYLNSHLGSVLLLQTVPFCTGERISGLGCAGFDELSRSWLSPTPFSTPAVVSLRLKFLPHHLFKNCSILDSLWNLSEALLLFLLHCAS